MDLLRKTLHWWWHLSGTGEQAREAVLDLLRHRYVREKQHAMRYRQHAERIHPRFRATLVDLAWKRSDMPHRSARK